jgi:spore coat protein U-like protein
MSQFFVHTRLGAAASAAMLLAAQPVMAATRTSNVTTSAKITRVCTMTSTPLAFGEVRAFHSTAEMGVAELSVSCTNGTSYSLSGFGTGTRNLADGTKQLPYSLWKESGWTTAFVDGETRTGTGSQQVIPIHGRIQPTDLTAAQPGSYTDTLVVTLTY